MTDRTKKLWVPNGWGSRIVDRYHIVGNSFLSANGEVAWHLLVYKTDRSTPIEQYWLQDARFYIHLATKLDWFGDGTSIETGPPATHLPPPQEAAMREAVSLLETNRRNHPEY